MSEAIIPAIPADKNTWGSTIGKGPLVIPARRQALDVALAIAACNAGGANAARVLGDAKAIEEYLTAGEAE